MDRGRAFRASARTELASARKGIGMKFLLSGRVRVTALVAVVVGLAVGGIAYASIPDSHGVIHGCYQNGGNLRVIDSSTGSCRPSEVALNWNQTGPTGERGPTGGRGPTGSTGISGYQVVTVNSASDTTDYKTVTAVCPTGKQILGGGAGVFWQYGAPTPHPKLISSFIYNSGWYGEADDGGAGAVWYIQAQAICANVN